VTELQAHIYRAFPRGCPRIRVQHPYHSSEAVTRSFKVSEYEATHGAIGGTPGYSPDPSIDRTYNYRHDVE